MGPPPKSRIARNVQYMFAVSPADGGNAQIKHLEDLPADVGQALQDAILAECSKSDDTRRRHARYLNEDNQAVSLTQVRCMIGDVISKSSYAPKPRQDPHHSCTIYERSNTRVCCYLRLVSSEDKEEAVLSVYPKADGPGTPSWQDLA
jgi:hypothetical protein